MKRIFCDTETTGVNPKINGMIQLSGVVEIDDEIVDRIEVFAQPFPDDEVSLEALGVHGLSMNDIKEFPEPELQVQKFIKFINKYINPYNKTEKFEFWAYNANFDYQVVRSWVQKTGFTFFGSYFWFPPYDLMELLNFLYNSQAVTNKISGFSLDKMAELFEIEMIPQDVKFWGDYSTKEEKDKFHNATYDVYITYEIFKKLRTLGKYPLSDGRRGLPLPRMQRAATHKRTL